MNQTYVIVQNILSHISHNKILYLEWIELLCYFRLPCSVKILSYISHKVLITYKLNLLMWFFKFPSWVKILSHTSHYLEGFVFRMNFNTLLFSKQLITHYTLDGFISAWIDQIWLHSFGTTLSHVILLTFFFCKDFFPNITLEGFVVRMNWLYMIPQVTLFIKEFTTHFTL